MKKIEEKVSNEFEVAVCANRLDLIELECSFKSTMRSKSYKNVINFL